MCLPLNVRCTSSSVSPSPSIMEDFVIRSGFTSFAAVRTNRDCLKQKCLHHCNQVLYQNSMMWQIFYRINIYTSWTLTAKIKKKKITWTERSPWSTYHPFPQWIYPYSFTDLWFISWHTCNGLFDPWHMVWEVPLSQCCEHTHPVLN